MSYRQDQAVEHTGQEHTDRHVHIDRTRARVLEVLKLGSAVRQFFGPNHIFNETLHIRGIVDGEWVVWRTWSKSRRSWVYQIDWYYKFWLMLRDGNLQTLGGKVIPALIEEGAAKG